jgi:ubiquinone/menaquinone biosynthesis C-methylase UbiE
MEKKAKGSCIACNGELTLFGPRLNYEYYICVSCATLQLFPMPDQRILEVAYSQQYASANQVAEFTDPNKYQIAGESYRRDILRTLIDYNISGLIIDFGSGWGHLCEMLIENGFNCRGVELSLEMSSYCKQKGLPVQQGGFELVEIANENISAIVMCAVFEHLTNHQTWLQRFNRILPIDGSIITLHPTAACFTLISKLIRFWNRQKELPELHGCFSPPWHTALFSLEAMEIVARQNGFRLIEIRPASQGRSGGLIGLTQRCLEIVNRIGWSMVGLRWPLITTHIFVLRKARDLGSDPP